MLVILGVVLGVLSAIVGCCSKQLLAAADHFERPCLSYLGFFLNIVVGPITNGAAYAFAPQVVVAPLSSVDVVVNALTAPRTLWWQGEVLTKAHWAAVALVTLGAIGTSVFSESPAREWTIFDIEDQLLRPASIAFVAVELVVVVAVLVLLWRKMLSAVLRGLALGCTSGALMGNMFFAKSLLIIVENALAGREPPPWDRASLYLLILGAAAGPLVGQFLMKMGLSEYKDIYMVTLYQGAHIVVACLSGVVVMEEMSGSIWWHIMLYWISMALILGGLTAIGTTGSQALTSRAPSGLFAEINWGRHVGRAAIALGGLLGLAVGGKEQDPQAEGDGGAEEAPDSAAAAAGDAGCEGGGGAAH